MKRMSAAATVIWVLLPWNCIEALAGVVGTQCWINGKLVGGFPPGYVCPGTGGDSGSSPAPSFDYEAERQRQETERLGEEEADRQRQRVIEEERKREEEETRNRAEEFEQRKQEALNSMKGITENELGLKGADSGGLGLKDIGDSGTGGLGLKAVGDTGSEGIGLKGVADSTPRQPLLDSSVADFRGVGAAKAGEPKISVTEPPEQRMKKEIEAAGKRIPELRKEIKGLQTLLKQFGANQRGNVSEFEEWQEAFRAAAENSRKNAVEYGLSMFLQYNLMGSLEGGVRKDTFGKLDSLINTSDPAMRRWLGEQMKKRNVELERVKRVLSAGTQAGDLAALLSGDPWDEGKALDALLFVNDLLETTKIVSWTGSQYFQQAKMIGETYTDLAAFGFSAASVRKAEKATDAYNREIRRLSWKLESTVKELKCLETCLDAYTDRCLDRCTGKTRFGSPPPTP